MKKPLIKASIYNASGHIARFTGEMVTQDIARFSQHGHIIDAPLSQVEAVSGKEVKAYLTKPTV